MRETLFCSTQTTAVLPTAVLRITVWEQIPQMEIWTEDDGGKRLKMGPSVILKGEEYAKFVAFVSALKTHNEAHSK